jgi:uncharacterized protein
VKSITGKYQVDGWTGGQGNENSVISVRKLTIFVYLQENAVMTFGFDQQKSFSNKEKHGIDFEEAQYLWLDPERMVIPARTLNELRCLMVAWFNGAFWCAVYTGRGDVVRIISVRKSRKNEKEIYQR